MFLKNAKYYIFSFGLLMTFSGATLVLADENVDTQPVVEQNEEETSYIYDEIVTENEEDVPENAEVIVEEIEGDVSQSAAASEVQNQGWELTESNVSATYRYRDENGKYVSGFATIDGKDYYFGSKDTTTYYGEPVMFYNTTATIDGSVYFFNNDGSYFVAQEGWNDNGFNKYYVQNGSLLTNSILNDGTNQYVFDSQGRQVFNNVTSVYDSGKNYYVGTDSDGHVVKNQFFQGYYFDSDGHSVDFITIDGYQYGPYRNQIANINGTNYIFDITGCASIAPEGLTTNINTYYVVDGALASGIYEIDGKEYYFYYGTMKKNQIVQVSEGIYYGINNPNNTDPTYAVASKDGSLLKNQWFTGPYEKIYGSYSIWMDATVYAGADGLLVDGLQTISGKQYYFNDCHLVTSSVEKINDEWYGIQENGECALIDKDGWVFAGESTYYFENGKPVDGVYTIDGEDYLFVYNVLHKDYAGRKIYLDGKYMIYVTDSSGRIVKNQWTRIENGDIYDGDYYLTENGSVLEGFQTVDGKNLCFDSTGRKYASELREINHRLYKFDEDGSYTTDVSDGFYYGAFGVQWVKNGFLVRNCMVTYNNKNYVLTAYGDSRRLSDTYGSYESLVFMPDGPGYRDIKVYPTALTGELLKSDFIKNDNGSDYYADENSILRYGLIEHNGEKYVIMEYKIASYGFYDTQMVRSTPLTIKGVNYYADENGVLHETVKKSGHSISLEGNIGVNFYLDFADYVLTDDGAKLELSVAGKTVSLNVKDAVKQNNSYRFSAEVTSAQMTTDIVAKLILSDGNVAYTEKYSVKQYCNKMLAKSSTSEKLRTLLESLLNYGGYAQTYFKYNTDHLANQDLTNTDVSDVTADTLSTYKTAKTGSQTGLTFRGSTLVLESLTSIRHYFAVESGHKISEYIFKVNGKTVKPIASGDEYYVEIPNIASADLDEMYTLGVGGFTVKYSALSYAYGRVNKTGEDEALQNVCRALYKYNQAANAFFTKS